MRLGVRSRLGFALAVTAVGLVVARSVAPHHARADTAPVVIPGGMRAQVADVLLQNSALGSVTSSQPGTALVTVRVAFTNLGGPTKQVGPYSQLDLRLGPSGPPATQDPGFVGSTGPLTSVGGPVAPGETLTVSRSFAVPRWALGQLALRVTPDVRSDDLVTIATRLPVPHPA